MRHRILNAGNGTCAGNSQHCRYNPAHSRLSGLRTSSGTIFFAFSLLLSLPGSIIAGSAFSYHPPMCKYNTIRDYWKNRMISFSRHEPKRRRLLRAEGMEVMTPETIGIKRPKTTRGGIHEIRRRAVFYTSRGRACRHSCRFGLRKSAAKALVYLAHTKEATSHDIERCTISGSLK